MERSEFCEQKHIIKSIKMRFPVHARLQRKVLIEKVMKRNIKYPCNNILLNTILEQIKDRFRQKL